LQRSQLKKTRGAARAGSRVPLGAKTVREEPERERAFLVGLDVRTRGRSSTKGAVTAQASAARDAAATQPPPSGVAVKSNGKPSIPEFDAEESLAELRTLAESAGAKVVGEILQRRDRPIRRH
jgi:hypothetical protein